MKAYDKVMPGGEPQQPVRDHSSVASLVFPVSSASSPSHRLLATRLSRLQAHAQTPPRPHRMALSALVNSPEPPLSPPALTNGHHPSPSGSTSGSGPSHPRPRFWSGTNALNGIHTAPTPSLRVMRPDDKLSGNEDVWEAGLKRYQARRELEAETIAAYVHGVPRLPPPPAKARRKPAPPPPNLDDELLGLAETSPPPDIVLPSGLPRLEVIRKIESNDMRGLTEVDVKAVQDEMWLRNKDGANGNVIRKDGTLRRKPGPAKGWKKLRGLDEGSEDGSSSVDPNEAEAEAELVALLDEPKPKKPRRAARKEEAEELEPEDPEPAQDERGVSEREAARRLEAVEDLQKQVWAAIVRDVPRMYRVYQAYDSMSKQNRSRTAQACVRNAFLQRTMKPTYKSLARLNKDAGTRGRRVVKEMLLYWRKNEKDELVARKKAEKEALDRAKAEEEAREAKRQSRKLNFLLTQTELYSHFIGKKIKTADMEGPEGELRTEPPEPQHPNEEIGLDDQGEALPDIDYDDDDEDNLRKHAARGAQMAVKAAKDKAAAFDSQRAQAQLDELNFQEPSLAPDAVVLTQPKMLMAQLKEYQLKGLTWLGNLYEQGINGILADEMGLGKTIQSISLLAYLAEHHNLWGPFLVIAPSSTLHNWQQELSRFVPRLKALPYWGSPKDRETLRRIWNRRNMTFSEDSPYHILVTSYQLAVQDEKYFQMVRWQYMILDEAQAIKSSSSARWKSLLSLHSRNRLLLTGTPIQNSMHELWALLHFIMPSLFDSHEEFSEWFSKDIENAAGSGGGTLKPEQLRRLHMILKPFMLRRVKKHVQKELGEKIEIDLLVDLSQRQRNIYKALRQRVSVSDLIAQANNLNDSIGAKNLMNLVMQFRKVCNHPDLFERADVESPFLFGTFSHSSNIHRQDNLYCPDSVKNAIRPELPRLIYDEKLDRPSENSLAGSDTQVLDNLMSIWSPAWISERITSIDQGEYGFLKILDVSPGKVATGVKSHPLARFVLGAEEDKENIENAAHDASFGSNKPFSVPTRLSAGPLREITQSAWNASYLSRPSARFAVDSATAPLIVPSVSSRSFNTPRPDYTAHDILYGPPASLVDSPASLVRNGNIPPRGLITSPSDQTPISPLRIPPIKRLIIDSAKLARLDILLRELKDGGHRVLLYFQMTKMMDLVEEYLIYRQHKYLRLDGASAIGDRRDMVASFQTNPDIFVFCLSTRAGGLGINLTAADTVIFYDHDWNPSNDAQAMDRAHRVGQTKQVTVYRLIARGTIEERIIKLARAKKDVQDIVVGTKSLTDVAKPSEIVSLFMDDEDLAESIAKRKQAEAHGFVAPSVATIRPRSTFGDGFGVHDDDEDDFFSLAKRPANGEDEDFGAAEESKPGSGTATPKDANGKPKRIHKRKASGEAPKKSVDKKKVKIVLGPDGLPL